MLKRIAICSGVFGLALAFRGAEAFAQSSSNCIATGPNMVHCDKVLLVAANVSGQANSISPMQYADMKNQICALEPQYKILRTGASVEVSYFGDTPESAGTVIGSLAVNGRDCGL